MPCLGQDLSIENFIYVFVAYLVVYMQMYQNILIKMYGFCLENAMGYGISESMGYGLEFPAYRHGSSKVLWGMREYGLSGVWIIRVSTVQRFLKVMRIAEKLFFIPEWEFVMFSAKPVMSGSATTRCKCHQFPFWDTENIFAILIIFRKHCNHYYNNFTF